MNAARRLCFAAIGIMTVVAGCGGSGGSSGGSENQSPVASFVAAPDNGPTPLQVQFDASASRDADGSVASYSWNFGDSTPAVSGVTASHTFQAAGTYTVTLTVKDSSGATASMTRQVTVSEPMPASVDVPNVVGMTQADAFAAIGSAGLNVGTVTTAESVTVAVGGVMLQTPMGGTSAPRGSAIDLIISSGNGVGAGQISLLVEPADIDLSQGTRGVIKVSLLRGQGLVEPVTVRAIEPPTGIIAGTLTFSGSSSTEYLPIRIAPGQPQGTITLSLRGDAGVVSASAQATITVSAAAATAQELIASSLGNGGIDYGTSLLYRAYALFADPRLPEAYRGTGSVEEDNMLLREIQAESQGLSPELQQRLGQFVVRPDNPSSAWNQFPVTAAATSNVARPNAVSAMATTTAACQQSTLHSWMSIRSSTHPVRVWVQCSGIPTEDDTKQLRVQKTLGILDKIYDPMTLLMGNVIEDVEGPDNAIDFYLVEPLVRAPRDNSFYILPGRGATFGDDPKVHAGASSFVLLAEEEVASNTFHVLVIHEFFHVLQNTHNASYSPTIVGTRNDGSPIWDQHWFAEAAATWAGAHFDRTLAETLPGWEGGRAAFEDVHWMFGAGFVDRVDISLTAPESRFSDDRYFYSTYVWPYFVELEKGDPSFMGQIFLGLEGVAGGDWRGDWIKADGIISSQYPFADNFKIFALRNLNRPYEPGDPLPERIRYFHLDNTFVDAVGPVAQFAALQAGIEYRYAVNLASLSAEYFQLEVNDGAVRKVVLDFTGLQPADVEDAMALIHTSNGWVEQPFDFSNEGALTFCFDDGPTTVEQRGSFDKIVLVLANHSMAESSVVRGTLSVQPLSRPCETVWRGTAHYYNDDSDGGFTRASLDATLSYDSSDVLGDAFAFREGTFTDDELLNGKNCRITYHGSGALVPVWERPVGSPGTAGISMQVGSAEGPNYYIGGGDINVVLSVDATGCDGGLYDEVTWRVIWLMDRPQLLSEDGKAAQGVLELNYGPNGVTSWETERWEWSFKKVRE